MHSSNCKRESQIQKNKMGLKVFLILCVLGTFQVESYEAARASCEFGPMDGIDSK